jgi:predicted RNA-binding protein YlxR (DUF448 family)
MIEYTMQPNLRCCVSCRRIAPKTELWRIIKTYPDYQVQLDQGNTRTMGRSAYLCPQRECLQTAQKKKQVERSLKTSVPEKIYERLWDRLVSDTIS